MIRFFKLFFLRFSVTSNVLCLRYYIHVICVKMNSEQKAHLLYIERKSGRKRGWRETERERVRDENGKGKIFKFCMSD